MTGVVQAACPGCKTVLNIPTDWMHQPIRCKHCGMVVCARPAAAAPTRQPVPVALPARATARPSHPVASAAPVAIPVGPPPPQAVAPHAVFAANAFADLEGDAGGSAQHSLRRRSRRGWGKGTIFSLAILAVAAVLTVVYWPQLKELVKQTASQATALNDTERDVKEQPQIEKAPPKTDRVDASAPAKKPEPKKEAPKKEEPKKELAKNDPPKNPPPAKGGLPKDPPKKELPNKETPKKETPVAPPVQPTRLFPRRALAISVNNYLFLNPINYGSPLPKFNSVHTLLERFTTGLRLPAEQIFELSDAAPMGRAHPPVKLAIEKAIADFAATSRPQDRIILLLVAHTVEIDGAAYLIPLEGDQEKKDTLIPLAWVYDKLAAAPARQKILVFDSCRFNPTRGQERPGGGPMGAKLDAQLKEPPPGVQVWTACTAGQQSYEFDSSANGNVNNGLFLDCLQRALLHGIEGTIQRPEEPIRVDSLVDKVNGFMKAELAPLKLEQTSRLTGKEAENGAAYDSSQPPAVKIALEVPRPAGDELASVAEVRAILKQIEVPPIKLTRDDMLIRAEAMPPFSAQVLAQYKDDGATSPFREAIGKARQVLHEQIKGKHLKEEWQMMGNENQHKAAVKDYQEKEVARTIRELEETLDDLRAAGKEGRKEEKSKRWQANYDYILARLAAQIAYLYEYDSALGEMRKELPDQGPNGWRLASQQKLSGDPAGRKLYSESSKLLDKLAKDHPGTPWEILARRDRLSNLGLKWQPNK